MIFQKEEKDAAALAVATVVDAGTLYQQETTKGGKPQERISSNAPQSKADDVIEINATPKPVISKYKIANLNLW